jgi:hypothetical protein
MAYQELCCIVSQFSSLNLWRSLLSLADSSSNNKGMYNLDTAARYSKYKTQLKHNIIQWSYLKHVSYRIHCTNQNIQ